MILNNSGQEKHLYPRQLQILRTVASHLTAECCSPTIGELALQLGISRSTAFEHIGELRNKGLLSALPGKARSLNLTSAALQLLDRLSADTTDRSPHPNTAIPLLGKVAAGLPLEAVENKDLLSFASCFGGSENLFALRVASDSMIDDGIRDGDYVICRRTSVAENGQIVVAIVDSENATLKRFYREKTHARLQPANANYDPICSDNCRIEAVIVGIIRRL